MAPKKAHPPPSPSPLPPPPEPEEGEETWEEESWEPAGEESEEESEVEAKPTSKRASDAQKDDGKDTRNRKKAKNSEGEGEEKKEKAAAVSAPAPGGVDNVKVKKGGRIGSISGVVKEGEKKGVAKVDNITGIVKDKDVLMDDVRDDEGDFHSKYPHLSQWFDLDGSNSFPDAVKISNLSLIDRGEARELEEKCKNLELKFFLERFKLMVELFDLVFNARKSQ